ncbi:MAG: GNAT family N-acetyltransferase [Amaricoccus sp.]|uniref:GNAT family N-acetyltransferase n=1 Tax=Amaricoccus sp. TaxID=1872485 RepID=UPI003314595A
MVYGLPNTSYIGYPIAVPCVGHSGLGFREATRCDEPAILEHFRALDDADRRMRFCATLGDERLVSHVGDLWDRADFALVALDGPLWPSPLGVAGPVRALAELSISGTDAEIGISVDPSLRRRGVGTYLTQTAGWLLARRGVRTLRAQTLPGNNSMITLGHRSGAVIEQCDGEVEIIFSVPDLADGYLRRRYAPKLLTPGGRDTELRAG